MSKFLLVLPDRSCKVRVRVEFPDSEDLKEGVLYESGEFFLLPFDKVRLDISGLFSNSED